MDSKPPRSSDALRQDLAQALYLDLLISGASGVRRYSMTTKRAAALATLGAGALLEALELDEAALREACKAPPPTPLGAPPTHE